MDIPLFQFFYKKSNSSLTCRKPTTSCYLFVKKNRPKNLINETKKSLIILGQLFIPRHLFPHLSELQRFEYLKNFSRLYSIQLEKNH